MEQSTGITLLINLYNFINERLVKDEVKVRVGPSGLEFVQKGRLAVVPEYISDFMVIPDKFKEGYIRKSDLIELYEELKFIVVSEGRVPTYYMNSNVSPEIFGFTIWSRYLDRSKLGTRKVNTFSFKVRNKLGFKY